MKLYSTNNKNLSVSFKEAVFTSFPSDKGLYMPWQIPKLSESFIQNITDYSFPEMALEIAHSFIGEDIPIKDLEKIIKETISFDAPLVSLEENLAVLELFHGPSLAFKDFGARFMSRLMAYLSDKNDKTLDILVATSGDTGGAVALGFLGVEGTRVTILYPKGKISEIQRKQLTTNGQNIRALEVNGTFDDCQALVKMAFNDAELNSKLRLTSANSINISRLLPQTFYYLYAYAQAVKKYKKDIVFVVPSGNFGNIGAGLLAYKSGLPVKHFVAATNVNDTVPVYLQKGTYEPKPSIQTLSNAMDVGNPSNWVRITDLFNESLDSLRNLISAYSFTDSETMNGINELYEKYNYIACPHTAVAYLAAKKYNHPQDFTIFLSTAHPCKFMDVYPENLKNKIIIPEQVKKLDHKISSATPLENNFSDLKTFLMNS
ncbi:threonine synthase [Apibacter sp. wkB309]|uniref:threonine synthase n=1 Tax=Apibacter sp. wkB309 TaxID=1679467 RepID=UPI000CFA3925|nr:threonine synthase [Apibacter sp. wkB309]PQL92218.1 threonine synthase [Apibacter sp. wkB309]